MDLKFNVSPLSNSILYLLKQLERALLRDISKLTQTLDRLQASRVLLLADNAALLRLHQVLLRKPTGRVLSRAVENLRSAARRQHISTLLLTVLACSHTHRRVHYI
jgi:hypothetical protein